MNEEVLKWWYQIHIRTQQSFVEHCVQRCMKYRPESIDVINRFIHNGTIPSNNRDLHALSVIFSNLVPNLHHLTESKQASILTQLYPIMQNLMK